MARVVEELPPIERANNGGRKSPWSGYADGKLWELNVFDDLGYEQIAGDHVDVDGHARGCQSKALNSARQWAKNHAMTVQVRRQGLPRVVVRFLDDPEGKLKRR